MIKTDDIYAATNGGLDIILYYYPHVGDFVNTTKSFKIRDEHTASCRIRQQGNVWKITDFGDDGHAISPIDIVMREENIRFTEAILLLADRYNIRHELNTTINKPDIRKRAATVDEPEGYFAYECKKEFTKEELSVLGPKVAQNHVDALSYKSLAWYSRTKKNDKGELETTTISSNDNYPIFMRDCGEFQKIYQPLNPDKGFRFFYAGTKPQNFVNGLTELEKTWHDYNESARLAFESSPENEGKAYKEKKLDAACICSGERDALNCKSFGYPPLWLNSESAILDVEAYKRIMKCVERLYNIPDADTTGVKKGLELAFRYIDIRTVKLPEWLCNYKDMRGKPRKDLRDYVELRATKSDFEGLLNTAMPIRFWEKIQGKSGMQLEINTAYLLHFLAASGFGMLEDPITKKNTLVLVKGAVVKEVSSKDIRAYLLRYLRSRMEDIDVINLVLNSRRTSSITMDDLPTLSLEFKDNDEYRQFMFFNNTTLEISADRIVEHKLIPERYVWEHKVSEHKYKPLPAPFEITQQDDGFHINIKNMQSHYFRYLINSSRIYWREELEKRQTGDANQDEQYAKENKFAIAGSRLNDLEIQEQMQNLINKIFVIGYVLHRKKEMTKTWAVWTMEDKISDDGISSGGSGKSFMFKFLKNFKTILQLGGRNKKLTENPHIFENVTLFTDLILIDDADQYIDFNFFYDKITGDLEVNEKHVKTKPVDYEDSPKLIFTSNFPPRGNDPSTARRILFTVFSDYYHERTEETDYRETRRIFDDFNYELGKKGYKEEFWNEDINFLLYCLQFYLQMCKQNIKIQPPMHKVFDRMNIQIMGNQFRQWAEVYFSKEGENVDKLLVKEYVFQDFVRESNVKAWTTQQFTKSLKAFANQCDYIECLNPTELCNLPKRITRNVDGKTREHIYMKTVGSELNNDNLPF